MSCFWFERSVQCWDDGEEDDIRLCELLRAPGAQTTSNLNAGLHGAVLGQGWLFRESKEVRKLTTDELVGVCEWGSLSAMFKPTANNRQSGPKNPSTGGFIKLYQHRPCFE